MEEKEKKKQIAKISIFITSVFVIFLSITYAFINMTLQGTKKQVITAGNISLELQEDTNNITISDALPMYDEVGMIQEPFTFRLVNNTASDTNYILKLVDITTGDKLSTSDVKYYLTKDGVGSPALLSTITNGKIDSGTIAGNQTIEYTLRLWIDSSVTENSAISGKSLSYRVDVEVSQKIERLSNEAEVMLFATENLGENCKTYDDGTDTFLVGQCANNYVWYSGKLWRVVLKNNATGAVKMVTDNAITAIPYNSGNTAFENSYMDQWLKQEFLPTLHDASEYLVENSVWDATLDANTPARPAETTTVQRTVGLLNSYEYRTTYNNSDGLADYSTGYLNNKAGGSSGISWWLITPYSALYLRYVNDLGGLDKDSPAINFGVRPSVNLKSTIQIESGTGTQSDPYILKGDTQETINGTTLISTRYSGEYVTFNNELYRIVGVETVNGEQLTKITAVDKPSTLASKRFHSARDVIDFASADIKTNLETYYQSLATSNINAYNMIQPSTTWYLGTVGSNGESYKASICATVDESKSMQECSEKATSTTANIGLPRVGEMFTSQITRGSRAEFWTLTPYSASHVRIVDTDSHLRYAYPTYDYGARPSMYLKSTVKIASSNTGNGTYEKPYEIE